MERRAFIQRSVLGAAAMAAGLHRRPAIAGETPATAPAAALGGFRAAPAPDNTRGAPGLLMHFLARSADTGGGFALLEARGRPGMEPQRHLHRREDESVYLLEGSMHFEVGGEEFELEGGDMIFMPRDVPHGFKVLSDEIHALLLLTPGGLDDYFWQVSAPVENPTEIPAPATEPPPPEVLQKMMELLADFGVERA